MNLIARLGIASAILISNTIYAAEPDDGWYAGLMIGASYLNNLTITTIHPSLLSALSPVLTPIPIPLPITPVITPIFPLVTAETSHKIGINGGGQVGYRLCDNYRLEGELKLNYNQLEKIDIPGLLPIKNHQNIYGLSLKGNTGVLAGFFNGYYDFYTPGSETSFVPYIGLGIGYAYIRTTSTLYWFNQRLNGSEFRETETAPIGQGILGISYFADETISIGLDFRYWTTRTIKKLNERLAVETLNLVLNFGFDQPM